MNNDNKKIEELFKDVENILATLEDANVSLEDSFKFYEKGMKTIKTLSSKIDKLEKDLVVLEDKQKED